MTNNMELWASVCETDPDHTTRVKQRGGFTAIDAMYQIRCATEQFGVAGVGWGWSYSNPIYPPNGTVVIKCTLWHGNKEQTVEQFGQKKLGDAIRPDEDALKKAATDGLTKCLSYLGFNADVFLGKFDDSKYVEALNSEKERQEKEENEKALVLERAKFGTDIESALNNTNTFAEVEEAGVKFIKEMAILKRYERATYDKLVKTATEYKTRFAAIEKEVADA